MRYQPFFRDRTDAGKQLAERLSAYKDEPDVVVLALPRGGVPVAYPVAEALNAPLDVFLVRKLGVPGHEELAMGAIASGGVRVLNETVVRALNIPKAVIDAVAEREQQELERRERVYREGRPSVQLRDRICILVDDGLATGASMHAAITALRTYEPREIVVAVPAAAPETCEMFEGEVDDLICVFTPEPFYGVGMWYADFSQTTDEEVIAYLRKAAGAVPDLSRSDSR